MKQKNKYLILQVLFFTLISFILSYQIPRIGFFQGIEKNLTDTGFKTRTNFSGWKKMDDRLMFLDIDGDSLNEYGKWPWPRSLIGEFINILNEFNADRVMLDIEFVEKSAISLSRDFSDNIMSLFSLINSFSLSQSSLSLDEIMSTDHESILDKLITNDLLRNLDKIHQEFKNKDFLSSIGEFLKVISFDISSSENTIARKEEFALLCDKITSLFYSDDYVMQIAMRYFNVHLIFHFLQSLTEEDELLSECYSIHSQNLKSSVFVENYDKFLLYLENVHGKKIESLIKKKPAMSGESEDPFRKLYDEFHLAFIQKGSKKFSTTELNRSGLQTRNSQKILIHDFINNHIDGYDSLEKMKTSFISTYNIVESPPYFDFWEKYFDFYFYKLKGFNLIKKQFNFKVDPLDTITKSYDYNTPVWDFTQFSKEIGFSNTFPDIDGVYREIPLVLVKNGVPFYQAAFSLFLSSTLQSVPDKQAKLSVTKKRINIAADKIFHSIPLEDGKLIINWAGEWLKDFPHISAKSLLDYNATRIKFLRNIIDSAKFMKEHDPPLIDELQMKHISVRLNNLINHINYPPNFFFNKDSILQEVKNRISDFYESVRQSLFKVDPASLFFYSIIDYSNFFNEVSMKTQNCITSDFNTLKNVRDWLVWRYYNMVYDAVNDQLAYTRAAIDRQKQRLDKYSSELETETDEENRKRLENNKRKTLKMIDTQNKKLKSYLDFEEKNKAVYNNLKELKQKMDLWRTLLSEKLKGKILFVGLTATGTTDIGPTPLDPYYMLVGIHINIMNTLLTKNFLTKVNKQYIYFLALTVAFLSSIVYLYCRLSTGFITMILGIAAYFLYALFIFVRFNKIIEILPVVIILLSNYSIIFSFRYLKEERQKKIIGNMFSTMVSPEVLKYMQESPDRFRLTGEKKMATMFFSDVAGFTTISESLTAEDLAQVLNDYLTPMSNIILGYGGYIDKYEGDAIMADFGVPIWESEDPTSHAWKACWAALEQQEEIIRVAKKIKERYGVEVSARMGLNSGEVSAGNMGSETKFQYTVMGDAVNQAARFEPACKPFGIKIMIGEPTYLLAKDKIETRFIALMIVKGKTVPIKAYELVAKKGEWTKAQETGIGLFHEGWQLHAEKRFSEAIAKFKECLEILPGDGPSLTYMEICENYIINPPEEEILLKLTVSKPGMDDMKFSIKGEKDKEITFGRTMGEVKIDDNLISRKHLSIFWNQSLKQFFCKDLKSSNGTFINQSPITISPIEEKDVITLGSSKIIADSIIIKTWQGEWIQTSK